ncbi:MAG: SLC13 family permease [Odoribacter sp.]|nr:SLC13 family permease [Odoribacter sp.]
MNFSIIYVAAVLMFMLWALITDKLRPGLILFTAVVLFLGAGIVTPKEALEGFSNKGMITVALLYLVSEGVRLSGVLERITYRMLPKSKPGEKVSLTKALCSFLPITSFVSAFLNNTPVVVIFAPMIKNWAQKMQLPPTKFLIPLSYATILGGVCTLIGTSTNLVVNGLVVDGIAEGIVKNGHPLSMFELGRVGIFIALTGLFYLIMVSRYLLPSKRVADIENSDNSNPDYVRVEAMLSTRFPGLGKTLREFDFYRHYGANVRAVRRGGEIMKDDWMNTPLTTQDTLILDADKTFIPTWGESRVFWMLNVVGAEPQLGKKKRYLAVILTCLMIIGATVGELPFVQEMGFKIKLDMFFFAAVTAVIMAWTGMFSPRKYTKLISWDVLITIACAFGISKAMINSGFADMIGGYIIDLAEHAKNSENGIYIIMAALYLITNLFTELITNNAAAALAFPLAVSISSNLGIDPTPFFICICVAASASFSTPIGYQTNLIVQGIGGYKFTDFVKVGLPMNIILFLMSVFLIPLLY